MIIFSILNLYLKSTRYIYWDESEGYINQFIGYGRDAKVFNKNMNVKEIKILKIAIDLARENDGNSEIYHGYVSDMTFNDKVMMVYLIMINVKKEIYI